jgi:hypothetical protein
VPASDLSHRFLLTKRFFDDLVAFLRRPPTRLPSSPPRCFASPIIGQTPLTYPVFRIWGADTVAIDYGMIT